MRRTNWFVTLALCAPLIFVAGAASGASGDAPPKDEPAVADAATSPNPLTSTYGGWTAVENAGLAIAEASRLISLPGRVCSNGRPAPVGRADWAKFTADLRKAGLAAYQAAKKKDKDAMVDVAGTVSDACSACHDVYREKKGGEKDRCLP